MTDKRRITAEDLYAIKSVSHARISPDGKHMIYVLQYVDQDSEKKYSNLWIAPTDGSEPYQFTFGEQSDTSPEWSPDGKTIVFLSNRENADMPPALYKISFKGGEAQKFADLKGMVMSFAWNPDGTQLVAGVVKADSKTLERMQDEKKKKLGVVDRVYDSVRYKFDGMGYLSNEKAHLWIINVADGSAEQILTDDAYSEMAGTFSPDGKQIAFVSNHAERPLFEPWADDIFLFSIEEKTVSKLDTPIGGKGSLAFSPDGTKLAYYGYQGTLMWHSFDRLWTVSVEGGDANCLTGETDYVCSSTTLCDTTPMEMVEPIWSPDGKALYFQADYHGSSILMKIASDGGDIEWVSKTPGVIGSPTFSQDGIQLGFISGNIDVLPEVFTMKNGNYQQLTNHNTELLETLDLGKVEEVWFTGEDENDLQGWILYPPDFDEKKQYASILEIHGGPTAQYGFHFMHEFYFLAAQDYIVYYTNPRGGTGYGEEHCQAILGDWGNRDYADLMCWADLVEKKPFVDPEKMGVTGGSYGGYMTVWIIGHTNRFQAAVTQRCVSNLTSMWGSSDMSWATQGMVGIEETKPPYEDLENYWVHSPIAYMSHAITPTMVVHSENDFRCPIEQGEQVFIALQYQNVPSEMVRFPNESHGLSRGGRTDRRIARLNHFLRWFNKFLKGLEDNPEGEGDETASSS